MSFEGFNHGFFEFFQQLTIQNNRTWFQEHKGEYETRVVEPLQQFIQEIAPLLTKVSPHILADPRRNGGSMFRIYRDARFSKDKTPYKTHAALHFRHSAGKDVHAPGFYIHLGLDECFLGIGIWKPDPPSLQRIRESIRDHSEEWQVARDWPPFKNGFYLAGESLKTPPRGFEKDHPFVEDLKRKDYIAICSLPHELFRSSSLLEIAAQSFEDSAPFMRFICKALDLPF